MSKISLAEYNRRFDMIVQAFNAGLLTREQAIDAVKELTNQEIDHGEKGILKCQKLTNVQSATM